MKTTRHGALGALAAAGRDPRALWQVICRGFGVSEFIFPSPLAHRDAALGVHAASIAGHAWRTFWVTMVGFGIAIVVGMLLGFVIGSSRIAYAAMYPLMTGFNALPKAAFVPILVVWFGIGVGPAILTAFLISLLPDHGQHRHRPGDARARAGGRAARRSAPSAGTC